MSKREYEDELGENIS